jgi:hypothetical protein
MTIAVDTSVAVALLATRFSAPLVLSASAWHL